MAKGIGIDLGTANVLINVEGEGIVVNEPSVVAVDKKKGQIIAVGEEAYEMVGKTPGSIEVVRPLKNGVIADFDLTEALLNYFINKLNAKSIFSKPNILVCCPTNITSVEQKAIRQVAEKAGGKEVYLEFEPKVAAVGSGLDIFKPSGNLIIDIGGGTSDIAVLSLGEIVASSSIRIAGNQMDFDLSNYIKKQKGLIIGRATAEKIKKELADIFEPDENNKIMVRGRDFTTGMPKEIEINEVEVREALDPAISQILAATQDVLQRTPPELSADIIDKGIVITGGGALLRNIDKYFAETLQIPASISDNPLDSVATGAGILLNKLQNKG